MPVLHTRFTNKSPKKKFFMHKISNLLNIQKIVTIHYQSLPSGYVSKEESHDFWEMDYVDKGKVIANTESKTFILEEGQAIFHRPGEKHSHTSNREVANNMLVVSFTCNNDCMEFFKNKTFTLAGGFDCI